MQLTGTMTIGTKPRFVAQSLQDPEVLRASIPGCTKLEAGGTEGTFQLTMEIGIGGFRGEPSAALTVEPVNDTNLKVMLAGEGSSRIEAEAGVTLRRDRKKTLLRYDVTISASGAVARLGQKQIEGAASLLIGQFLRAFKKEVEARAV
jgi:carbon monoxide dehydrogenase subunit G